MAESLNQWHFVIGAYALGIGGTLAMVGWSWIAMVKAEARRDEARKK